jgi:hypothetical protein
MARFNELLATGWVRVFLADAGDGVLTVAVLETLTGVRRDSSGHSSTF